MWEPQDSSRGCKRAAKAIAEGRTPGKPGPKPLSEEERAIREKAKYARYRQSHLDEKRAYEAQWWREKRAKKALEEGRVPGVIGHLSTMTKEELDDYLNKWRGDGRKFIFQIKAQNSRCKNLGVDGKLTVKDILKILEEQQGCCGFCGSKFEDEIPEIDHWVPIKLGGTNDPSNIRLLHLSCNRTKGAKHPDVLFSELTV